VPYQDAKPYQVKKNAHKLQEDFSAGGVFRENLTERRKRSSVGTGGKLWKGKRVKADGGRTRRPFSVGPGSSPSEPSKSSRGEGNKSRNRSTSRNQDENKLASAEGFEGGWVGGE